MPRLGTSLPDWAALYASKGWPVLPLVPRHKTPLVPKGLLEASIDATIVDTWWRRWPTANIGVRTGVAFCALDIDGEVGSASLATVAGPGLVHPGPVNNTGRGQHWLYAPTNTMNRANMLPKLDWRGQNGYIIVPPSIHPNGHRYQWAERHGPLTLLPPVPKWLEDMMLEYKVPTEYPVVIPNRYDPLNDILQAAHDIGLQPRRKGSRYVLNCIFHEGDREASLTLYPDQRFFCFGCGAWGNARDLRDRTPGGKHG